MSAELPALHESQIEVRRARPDDAALLLGLVDMLADYEKLARLSSEARERLVRDTFGPVPRIQAFIAEQAGTPVGYAITLETYSSFLAQPTLYIEDIFVLPEYRRHGAGRAIFQFLAAQALQRECGRMEWAVLDWNRGAIDFYERMGARRLQEWQVYRLTAEQLQALADSDDSARVEP
jgi:GNAT superfamily N-acetyltransferase